MKRIAALPPKNTGGTFTGGTRTPVDWDKCLDGTPWQAERHKDFTCTTRTFASRVYQAAKKRNKRVSVRFLPNAVAFQSRQSA